MSQPRAWRADLLDMLWSAAPIVAVNVGLQLMGVVDMLMIGPRGGTAIAAVALGNFIFFNVSVFGIGLLMVLDPIVAQAVGAGAGDEAARGIQRGIILAGLLAALVMGILSQGGPVLLALRQPADVVAETARYIRFRSLGALGFFLFLTFRQALQAIGVVRDVVVALCVANAVNLLANWAFINGRWGAPSMGVAGSGLATAIASWCMWGVVAWSSWPRLRMYLRPWHAETWAWVPLRRTILLGLPIGIQFFFESFAFGLTAIFMGWFGATSLAGHEIALNMAALTYMVPLGLSSAAAVIVGRAIGRGDMPAARRDAVAAVVIGVGFMSCTALLFVLAPQWLANRYTAESGTVAVAILLIPLAGYFQIFDALQAITSGVLRGTGDTRIPALLHIVAFWGVGVPLGAYLGFRTALRERGLWIGLVIGLATAALLQTVRVRARLRGDIARVRLEE